MDQGGMANLRKQAAGEVLSTDGRGKEATDQRTLEVVAAFGCNRRRAAAGRVNEDAMKEVKKRRGGRRVFGDTRSGKRTLTQKYGAIWKWLRKSEKREAKRRKKRSTRHGGSSGTWDW